MRISSGSSDRLLSISQQYYQTTSPLPDRLDLRVATELGASISYGELVISSDLTRALSVDFEAPIQYESGTLYAGRFEQLLVLGRVNHFEYPVKFQISGDRLVVLSQQPDPDNWLTPASFRPLLDITSTYIRVDARAVDQAFLLARFITVSQVYCFASFVHQLGAGSGPLLDALNPYSPEDALEVIQQYYILLAAVLERSAQLQGQSEEAKNARVQWRQDMEAVRQQPVFLHLASLNADPLKLGNPDAKKLGCVR
ncbi:MAG: hypothetical protein L3J33_01455 [Rhodobacteraceae bacterium]|nr:hypothetical protein [Paracoccaceae bacterium]